MRWFAENVFGGRSPLYTHFCLAIADDEALWDLIGTIPAGQPLPNMLFGAVHDRLLAGVSHPLAAYFPSVGGTAAVDAGAYPALVDFCCREVEAIRPILATRAVQTNEVGRSALWLPAMCRLAAAESLPLFLVECGTSAGLNLYWDRYGVAYSDGTTAGEPQSAVSLTCERRGDRPLPLRKPLPGVAGRLGIDLSPIDARDPDQVRWLQALLWPEQVPRAERLQAAVAVVRQDPPQLLAGDVLALLPQAVVMAPAETAVVVMHSFMANQLSVEQRQRLDGILTDLGQRRPLHRLAIEWLEGPHPTIVWTRYWPDGATARLLAEADQHGQWIEWLDTPQGEGQ
jgi:hypothetical protein